MSAISELDAAWRESSLAFSSKSYAWHRKPARLTSCSRTSPTSSTAALSESCRLCIRQGMIVDGCAWQPLMWERPTSDDAGSVSHDDAPRGTAMNRTKRTRDPGASRRTSAETGEANGEHREKNSDDKVVDDVVDSLVKELDLEEEAERVDDRPGTTTTDDAFDVPRPNATRETRSSRSLPLGEESGDDLDEPRLRNKRDAADDDDDDHPTISGRFDDEDPEAALPLPTRPGRHPPRRRERWPTPRAVDGNEMETSVALPLSVHVAVRELRALHGDVAPARPRQPRGRGYAEPPGDRPRLHLNPAFSEWLMGLPSGWTCLDGDVLDPSAHLRRHDRWASWHPGGGSPGGESPGGWSAGSQVALGVARQMDRCRAVGNSVVPTCVGVAWRVLTGLRHAVNPRTEPAPAPARSKHRLDPTRRVPVLVPDPRVRTEWGGNDGDDGGRWGSPHGQKGEEEEESGTRWKPWSAPWPTFFAPVDSNPRTLDSNPRNKRKRGAPGPTDDESAPETDDPRMTPSMNTGDEEKLEPWGDANEGVARGSSRRPPRRAEFTRNPRSGSPGTLGRPSVQGGSTRSKSTSQNREERAVVAARDQINALTASPDVRNGASALLRQLWESMLSGRAECERAAEALSGVPGTPARRNPGESPRANWAFPPPLRRRFESDARRLGRRSPAAAGAEVSRNPRGIRSEPGESRAASRNSSRNSERGVPLASLSTRSIGRSRPPSVPRT